MLHYCEQIIHFLYPLVPEVGVVGVNWRLPELRQH